MKEESVVLHNNRAGSDKIYRVELKQVAGGWVVNYRNGRRVPGPGYEIQGSAGGTKTPQPRPYESAQKTFQTLVKSKQDKGYRVVARTSSNAAGTDVDASDSGAEGDTSNGASQKTDSGKFPMLLNVIEDEAQALQLCDNPSYCCQEKEDGERRMLLRENLTAKGINRNGQFVVIPATIERASDLLRFNSFLFDGEAIGETLRIWDLLELDGEDLRLQSMQVRYERLRSAVPNYLGFSIQVVPTAFTRDAKLRLFQEVKARGGEGVVFKLVAAPYEEGKSRYALKFKFKAQATIQVVGISATKRSVQVGVAGEDGIVFVGNVTIPANKEIPTIGEFAEVEYLYAYPNGGSLFQPFYLGPRTDKTEPDRLDSLKFKRQSDEGDTDEESTAA